VTTDTRANPVSFVPMAPGDWGILEFHRPDTANAVDLASVLALEEAVAAIPDNMRLVVLRRGGTEVCARSRGGGQLGAQAHVDVEHAGDPVQTSL
jgi:enoyl-CoA hydratase/carnithine racemase